FDVQSEPHAESGEEVSPLRLYRDLKEIYGWCPPTPHTHTCLASPSPPSYAPHRWYNLQRAHTHPHTHTHTQMPRTLGVAWHHYDLTYAFHCFNYILKKTALATACAADCSLIFL